MRQTDFDEIFARIKGLGIDYGPSFHDVGTNARPGRESGSVGIGFDAKGKDVLRFNPKNGFRRAELAASVA